MKLAAKAYHDELKALYTKVIEHQCTTATGTSTSGRAPSIA